MMDSLVGSSDQPPGEMDVMNQGADHVIRSATASL